MAKQDVFPNLSNNAITLIDAQQRLGTWRATVKDLLGTDDNNTPISILIPISDLQDIVSGFSNLLNGYMVTGARLYLTIGSQGGSSISGVLVPVGDSILSPVFSPADIIVDVATGVPIKRPVDPTTLVSIYDFTHPCPPLGCDGASSFLNGTMVSESDKNELERNVDKANVKPKP